MSDTENTTEYTQFVWPKGGESGLILVTGGKVFYRLYGKDKPGTPLVLLHGGPGGSFTRFYTMLPLAEERPVLFYNQLGGGGTEFDKEHQTLAKVRELQTVDRLVEEVQQVIDFIGFKEFFLLGHSWGSMLEMEYALRKKPQGLKGIVVSGPFLNVDLWILDAQRLIRSLPQGDSKWEHVLECIEKSKDDPMIFAADEGYQAVDSEYSAAFGTRHQERLPEIPVTEDAPTVLDEATGEQVGAGTYNYMWGPSEYTCNGTLQGADVTGRLHELTVPVLYVPGQYDSGSPAAAAYYNALTPNGHVVVIEGTGHSSYFDNTPDYLRTVSAFFRENDR